MKYSSFNYTTTYRGSWTAERSTGYQYFKRLDDSWIYKETNGYQLTVHENKVGKRVSRTYYNYSFEPCLYLFTWRICSLTSFAGKLLQRYSPTSDLPTVAQQQVVDVGE